MPSSRISRLRESRVDALKTRARAKQKWLERMLSASAQSLGEIGRRRHWIDDALQRIKRAKADAMYRASVIDAYTEHLSVLEMTLMRAAEEQLGKVSAPDAKGKSSKS